VTVMVPPLAVRASHAPVSAVSVFQAAPWLVPALESFPDAEST